MPGRAQDAIAFELSDLRFFRGRLRQQRITILADLLNLSFDTLGLRYESYVIRVDNHLRAVIIFLTVIVAYRGLFRVDLRSQVL